MYLTIREEGKSKINMHISDINQYMLVYKKLIYRGV